MALTNVLKNLSKRTKILFAIAAVAVIAVAVVLIFTLGGGYTATTMRLLRVEGTVNIEDSNGGSKPVIDKIRFQSGDALNTGADGLASVGLDETKIVTLQSDSRVEFQKQNKKLELKLTKGALFFEVTEHLKDDETYEIHTSNMTVGIRGTSGYVYYDESDKRESLIVTDGVVEVSATNPETGETKTARVEGGKKIKVYLYSDRKEDTVAFELSNVSEDGLPEFPLQRLAEDEELLDRVCEFTGWDKEKLLSIVNGILEEEKKNDEITTPTATPTEEPTPTPEPVDATPGGPSAPTITPPVSITPTVKPTGVPTGSPTTRPTANPTITPVVTVTATPTAAPTVTITITPATTVTPAVTSTPAVTTTPVITSTPAVTSTPATTEAPTPTPDPADYIPDGYSKLSDYYEWGWGTEEYNGHTVFICYKGIEDEPTFKGWITDHWVDLNCYTEERDDSDDKYNYFDFVFAYNNNGSSVKYYVFTYKSAKPEPDNSPKPPEGYEYKIKGSAEYDGHTVYIVTAHIGDDYLYKGWLNGEWIDLESHTVVNHNGGLSFNVFSTYTYDPGDGSEAFYYYPSN